MRTTKKILSMILAFVMVLGLLPATAFATGEDVVYISVSYDGKYIDDQNGAPLVYVPVSFDELAAIDLDEYGLSEYKYDENGDGAYETTALQLVIYAHENIYGGSWSDVTFTGSPGSSYFQGGIFGFDENLNYYLNGEYPLAGEGWGATSDQIVLEAGDFLDIGSFSSWDFFGDSNYGFHFFADSDGAFVHDYAAETGSALTVKLVRSYSAMGVDATVYDEPGYTVYYGTEYDVPTGEVTTDDSGYADITFPSAGNWILWADGGYGLEFPDAIVSAPAYAKVTVTGETQPEQPSEPEEPEVGTVVEVTADQGILFALGAGCICGCGMSTDIYYEEELTNAEIEVSEWECQTHGATPPSGQNKNTVVVSVDDVDGYTVTGMTINGTRYDLATDIGSTTEMAEDCAYDGRLTRNEGYVFLTLYTVEAVPEDLKIHIHAEKEEPPREAQDVSAVLNATMAQMAATVTEPVFGTTAGEWTVFGLARGGYYAKDNAYFTDYYNRIVDTVNTTAAEVNMNGALHKNKSTENSRLIVALSAIGKDATSVGNWNLVEAYSANGFDWIKKQGLNGTIWALIALDSNNYATTDTTIRQQCVDAILAAQHTDGGWSLTANLETASDPDLTGMALTALYPYRDQAAVAAACEEAFACLSTIQNDNGTYTSGGAQCAESCSWVIVATTTWGINPDTDSRFIKNGNSVVDGLLAHYLADSATFQHIIGAGSNAMATDQSCYALVAYDRFVKGKNALYDYSDVTFEIPADPETDEMTATLGLPAEINGGDSFNGVISINKWDNEAGYKLIDLIVNVPEGVAVTGVTASDRLVGGELSWNLEAETGKLRVVYFDANENTTLTITGEEFPAELFTIGFKAENVTSGSKLDIAIAGMSVKLTSDSEAEASMVVVNTDTAKGTVDVVIGISFSAVCLYEGDDVDLIPSTKRGVAVAVTGISNGTKLTYNDGTNTVEFKYSAEITAKTGISTYVAVVDASIAMENFVNESYFSIPGGDADTVTFGDANGDGVINAQDALAAVDTWLRKGAEPTDIQILTMNVNGDSRINTFDALGIVEAFVNGTEYGVVTKAATITTKQ